MGVGIVDRFIKSRNSKDNKWCEVEYTIFCIQNLRVQMVSLSNSFSFASFIRGFTSVVVETAPGLKHIGYMLALNLQIGQPGS